ncbi:MAG: PTS sugar transporter [Microbacterium sp.]
MRILVVCGAGALSTFVAHRVRHAARDAGLDWSASAGAIASLPVDLDSADLVLVGAHLTGSLDAIRAAADQRGARMIVLPEDIATDRDGSRTLDLVRSAIAEPTPEPDATASA